MKKCMMALVAAFSLTSPMLHSAYSIGRVTGGSVAKVQVQPHLNKKIQKVLSNPGKGQKNNNKLIADLNHLRGLIGGNVNMHFNGTTLLIEAAKRQNNHAVIHLLNMGAVLGRGMRDKHGKSAFDYYKRNDDAKARLR